MFISFRDPSGQLAQIDGKIIRYVNSDGLADLDAFFDSIEAKKLVEAGHIIPSDLLNASDYQELPEAFKHTGGRIFQHPRIPFPTYPYEWSPAMLHAAAEKTLFVADKLETDLLELKDATPFNILFLGPEPVFIDILSFVRLDPTNQIWLAQAQFARAFLLPLLANREFGVSSTAIFQSRPDGWGPADLYTMASFWRKLMPPFLGLVSLPQWLDSRATSNEIYKAKPIDNPVKAKFVRQHLFRRQHRSLKSVAPKTNSRSNWSEYMSDLHYPDVSFSAKQDFVSSRLDQIRPDRVLDVGCNTGHFSALAAKSGSEVVSIDTDSVVIDRLWQYAREKSLNILPLVQNLASPSAALGWRNKERPSFLARAKGHFDLVLMLAVIHHLAIAERIPLMEIVCLCAEITKKYAILEFVGPEDLMFRKLLRGRGHLYGDLTQANFETAISSKFKILDSQKLSEMDRVLYLVEKLTAE
jgi:2-polyprenyl-3-methyl-5-hydroxy-6-metoxy-1,4-benzoquinol methylase